MRNPIPFFLLRKPSPRQPHNLARHLKFQNRHNLSDLLNWLLAIMKTLKNQCQVDSE